MRCVAGFFLFSSFYFIFCLFCLYIYPSFAERLGSTRADYFLAHGRGSYLILSLSLLLLHLSSTFNPPFITILTHAPKQAEVLGKRVVVQHIPLGGLLEWDAAATSTSPANTNINTENTTTPTTPIRTTTAQMSTSHLETLAHAQTRTTRIQPRSKAQGQGRGTPPALTTTTARVPWATTAPGGRSEATRAPWAAAMPIGTVTDSSGHSSSSGSGSMGPPRSPGMDIGG